MADENYKSNEDDSIDYIVLGSGSKGNAVRIENIMIDCGISYQKMKDELYKCKVLFITHIHSDHLKMRTFNQIKKHHKHLKVIANYQVAELVDVDKISNIKPIQTKDWKLIPFIVPHDAICQGLVVEFKNGTKIIYVTDSAGNKDWLQGKYDYLFIESNHDETLLSQIDVKKYGYDVINNSKRHTSKQESKAFYYLNRKDKNSKWIELHKSGRFYK